VDYIENFTGQAITVSSKIFLKTAPAILNPIEIIRKVWGFENGVWNVAGFVYDEEKGADDHGTSWISFTDDDPPTSGPGVNLFMIRVAGAAVGDGDDPILAVDRGMLVKKDFTAGGFLAANQGALWLGSGLNTQVDVPKIILLNSWVSRLGGSASDSMGAPPVPSGSTFPSIKKHYQLYILTNAWNGNPADTLYKWNDDNHQNEHWESMGPTSNYDGTFDTLYIRKDAKSDISGHLDVGDITIHGHLDDNLDDNSPPSGSVEGLRLSCTSDYLVCIPSTSSGGFSVNGYLAAQKWASTTQYGPLYRNGNGQIGYSVSSERFKDNIRVVDDCSWLYNLCPVSFDWKDKERAKVEGVQLGLVAEEVYRLCPQLTWLDVEGRPEGVHYEWLGIPLLVEVKKLRRELDELKTKMVTDKNDVGVSRSGGE
jgi:hypothetical protein